MSFSFLFRSRKRPSTKPATDQRPEETGPQETVNADKNQSRQSVGPYEIPSAPKKVYSSDDTKRGTPLKTHHRHTYLLIGWLVLLIIYIILMEYAVYAHSLSPDLTRHDTDVVTFGKQGTPWRSAVVQWFSVIRTLMTVAHVPIVTSALASMLPQSTQRTHGKNPPNLTATQLFLLADMSWAGAGGWFTALHVGNLPWIWWKLTLVTVATFFGFPIITLGYKTDAKQFWESFEYKGVAGWELKVPIPQAVEALRTPLQNWLHDKPQRNLGDPDVLEFTSYEKAAWAQQRGYKDMITIDLEDNLAFFPPAYDTSRMGHFVSLTPQSTEGLVVANTLGFIQTLQCSRMPPGQTPTLLDLSRPRWGCKNDCAKVQQKDTCHTQTSLGKQNGNHIAQVASCSIFNNVTSRAGITTTVEVAMKINPNYQAAGLNLPFSKTMAEPYSFKKGDALSGNDYYVEVVNCTMGYIPGFAVVDSIIRKYMHFQPLLVQGDDPPVVGDGPALAPEQEQKLWLHLGRLLNVTTTLPFRLLHESFLQSQYAIERTDNKAGLAYWFGVQKPGDPTGKSSKGTAQRAEYDTDKYPIDNMVRVNGTIFKNSLIGIVNSTLIEQLETFFIAMEDQYSFIYKTDVRLARGPLPIAFAPVMLLLPIFVVLYFSANQWYVATWTEFLDAWAMFKLGREWRDETTGEGAVDLQDSWQAKVIPGYVGDGGVVVTEKEKEQFGLTEQRIGYLQLGGKGLLRKDLLYT